LSKWFDIKVEINKDTLNAVAVLTTVIFSLYTSKLFIDKIKNENIENKDKNNK
jgi:hypothetical protein